MYRQIWRAVVIHPIVLPESPWAKYQVVINIYWHCIIVLWFPVFPFSEYHDLFISPIGEAEWKFDGIFVQSTIISHCCSLLSGIRRHGLHFLFLFKNEMEPKQLWSMCFSGWLAGPDPLGSWLYVMSPPIKEHHAGTLCCIRSFMSSHPTLTVCLSVSFLRPLRGSHSSH